jgi:hypothetical protein
VGIDRHRFAARLQAGKNTVLVKVCQSAAPNSEPNWEFFLRVADATVLQWSSLLTEFTGTELRAGESGFGEGNGRFDYDLDKVPFWQALDTIAERFQAHAAAGRDCFVYFINGAKIRAPHAAQALIERL